MILASLNFTLSCGSVHRLCWSAPSASDGLPPSASLASIVGLISGPVAFLLGCGVYSLMVSMLTSTTLLSIFDIGWVRWWPRRFADARRASQDLALRPGSRRLQRRQLLGQERRQPGSLGSPSAQLSLSPAQLRQPELHPGQSDERRVHARPVSGAGTHAGRSSAARPSLDSDDVSRHRRVRRPGDAHHGGDGARPCVGAVRLPVDADDPDA